MNNLQIIRPPSNKCPSCAVEHSDKAPHDATSFYYQFLFTNAHRRSPTWADAMAHCELEVKEVWKDYLDKLGSEMVPARFLCPSIE